MSVNKNTKIATTENIDLTKRDVGVARYKEQIRAIERHGRIAGWNDYLGFVVSKLLGVTGLVLGGLEALDPSILPITLKNPELVAGIGLALLTGKSVLTLIAKVERALRQR